ncbi:MAG: hypothetical protein V7765_21725 [Oleispira sp.]
MKDISFKGIIIALVIAIVLDIVSGIAGAFVFMDSFKNANEGLPTDFLVFSLIISFITTVIGGYISANIGNLAPYKNALIFAGIGMVLSMATSTFDPIWFDTIGLISLIPAAILGASLAVKKDS